jgi:hypothetical protein
MLISDTCIFAITKQLTAARYHLDLQMKSAKM